MLLVKPRGGFARVICSDGGAAVLTTTSTSSSTTTVVTLAAATTALLAEGVLVLVLGLVLLPGCLRVLLEGDAGAGAGPLLLLLLPVLALHIKGVMLLCWREHVRCAGTALETRERHPLVAPELMWHALLCSRCILAAFGLVSGAFCVMCGTCSSMGDVWAVSLSGAAG